jgi:Mu-like prophage I protein
MDGMFIVPSPAGSRWTEIESAPIALARVAQGKLFEKHILTKGPLIHPVTGERINVDDQFISTMMRNFENNVCDTVQVPLANDSNQHVENPDANKGEVIGLRERGGKVYAVIDAREDPDKFGKTYLGASAFLSTNYKDSRTGNRAGPTLLHVAVTNRPYVVGLEPYREIVAATASDDNTDVVVLTQEEQTVLTLDELKAALKNDHGIDVDALQASASQATDLAALTAALQANPALGLSGTDDQITGDDLVGAVVELSRQNVTLANGYQEMRRERAADRVDALVGTGHILPKQRDFAVGLLLSNPEQFSEFVPENPVVPVEVQTGLTAPDDQHESAEQAAEVARLSAMYTDEIVAANQRRRK